MHHVHSSMARDHIMPCIGRVSAFVTLLICSFIRPSASTCTYDPTIPCTGTGRLTPKGWVQVPDKPASEFCIPPTSGCNRPCGVYFYNFNQAAGFFTATAYIQPLFIRDNVTWAETNSLAHDKTMQMLNEARDSNKYRFTALRHPIHRAVSLFWATAEADDMNSFERWLER